MTKIKFHIVSFLLLFSVVPLFAQNSGFYWNGLNESSNRLSGKLTGKIYFISSKGNSNYFLQKDWVNSTIVLEDNDVFENVKTRYLAFGDQLVAFNEKVRTLYTVDKNTIKEFYLNGAVKRKFIKLHFTGINGGDRFFEELYSGNNRLVVFHHVDEVRVSPYSDNQGIMRDTEFQLNKTFYMYSDKGGFTKLTAKKRSFIKNFNTHKKEIRKILRQNKIMFYGEGSVLQAFTVLDDAGLLN